MGLDLYGYVQVLNNIESHTNISKDSISSLWHYALLVYQSDQQNRYSKPIPWIGIYIALASLFCIFAIVADLLHGFKSRKLWFPCKYFTLNAASLTVIAVAVKLPMDLNNIMPGNVDQAAKVGSMTFLCTMMANLLPSLATMNSNELLANIVALSILVITLAVNVCIQINTGVFHYSSGQLFSEIVLKLEDVHVIYKSDSSSSAIIYVIMLLMMLIIHICSSLAILKSKQIIESKYQLAHETALKDLELQQKQGRLTVEKLKRHVRNYWIMAGTGSPQFMTTCLATTFASGVICAINIWLQFFITLWVSRSIKDYRSDYKWSMLVILVIQTIGVVVGTIAPLFRCFAALSFKISIDWIWNHMKVFKVESYWTNKLSDWKHSGIPFSFGSRKVKVVIQNMKIVTLKMCIVIQKIIVVACKIIGLVTIFFVICVWCCSCCYKWLKAMFSTSSVILVQNPNQPDNDRDLSCYVLQLENDMELADRTLEGLLKSVNHLIQKAEKKQPKNLMKLLEESSGFEGVEKYDNHRVPPFSAEEYINCWSLPLVTLTTITIFLPKIQKNKVDRLLSSVSEGLAYVTLVEETLNATHEYVIIQKAAKKLWQEVEIHGKWLGSKVQQLGPQENTTGHILLWLKNTAKNLLIEVEGLDIGNRNDDSVYKSICSNSMYRITESILLSYHTNIEQVSQDELFTDLLSIISDILAACLTNLPQVIVMKCHASVIEKREASVHVAVQILGETSQIINILQDRELPSLNPVELPFIDKWRSYLRHPFP